MWIRGAWLVLECAQVKAPALHPTRLTLHPEETPLIRLIETGGPIPAFRPICAALHDGRTAIFCDAVRPWTRTLIPCGRKTSQVFGENCWAFGRAWNGRRWGSPDAFCLRRDMVPGSGGVLMPDALRRPSSRGGKRFADAKCQLVLVGRRAPALRDVHGGNVFSQSMKPQICENRRPKCRNSADNSLANELFSTACPPPVSGRERWRPLARMLSWPLIQTALWASALPPTARARGNLEGAQIRRAWRWKCRPTRYPHRRPRDSRGDGAALPGTWCHSLAPQKR